MQKNELSHADWAMLDASIDAALDAQNPQQALDEQLKTRPDLQQLARRWLKDTQSELETLDAGAAPKADLDFSLQAGTQVGSWVVIAPLAHGGMGEVYTGRSQRDDQQRVAIKVLRVDAVRYRERFLEERQMLARLEHPGVARLIDGGVLDDGRAYTVMEFVDGDSLADRAVLNRLTLAQRLALFTQVAEAVAFAHRNLIVHRDIKPENIRLTAASQPKLLDFGIAKLLQTATAGQTTAAQTTAAMATPAYAAPEQLANEPITTATDVYALGALLHYLLTGHAPWKLEQASLPNVVARVSSGEVMLPSQQVDAGALVSAAQLRGDLDAIVARATRAEPGRRYPTVEDLLDDVRAYLQARPVSAREGAWTYRVRCFVRRNAVASVAILVTTLALVSSAVGISVYARQAMQERDEAERRALRANALAEWFSLIMNQSGEQADGGKVPLLEVLRTNLAHIESSYADDPQTAAELLLSMAFVLGNFGEFKEAQLSFQRVLNIHAQTPLPTRLVADARIGLAQYELRAGQMEKARAQLDGIFGLPGFTPQNLLADYCRALRVRAWWERENGDVDAAMQTLADARELLGDADAAVQVDLLDSQAHLYIRKGDFAAAAALFEQAKAVAERQGLFTRMLGFQRDAATMLGRMGQVDRAHAAYREEVSIRRDSGQLRSADGVLAMKFLGTSELDLGQLDAAQATLLEGWSILDSMGDLDTPVAASLGGSLIQALAAQGENDQALAIADQLFAAFQPDGGIGVFLNAYARGAKALAWMNTGELPAARRDLDAALAIFANAPAGLTAPRVKLQLWLAQWGLLAGDREVALQAFTDAAQLAQTHLPELAYLRARAVALNAVVSETAGADVRAAQLQKVQQTFGVDHPFAVMLDAELTALGAQWAAL